MRAMTEIEWLDGRVTKVPELALGDALGESVQAELDFGFDDVLEGLWVEVRHHEPDEDSDGDPRGRGCALYADCRYSLVEPSDLDRVFCILYEGQPRVQPRRGGAREPFAGLRVVLPHARISLPARRPRGPSRVRSIPLRSGFHIRPRRPRPRRGGARAPMCRDLIQGIDCIRPLAFAAPPSGPARPTGFPSTARRSHLYICVHSRIGNMFRHTPPQGYTRSALHRYAATRLQGYTPPPGRTAGGSPMDALGPCSFF